MASHATTSNNVSSDDPIQLVKQYLDSNSQTLAEGESETLAKFITTQRGGPELLKYIQAVSTVKVPQSIASALAVKSSPWKHQASAWTSGGGIGVYVQVTLHLSDSTLNSQGIFEAHASGIGFTTIVLVKSSGTFFYNNASDLHSWSDCFLDCLSGFYSISFVRDGVVYAKYEGWGFPNLGSIACSADWH